MKYNLEITRKDYNSINLNSSNVVLTTGSGQVVPLLWGKISGNISDQIDLFELLNLKSNTADVYNKEEIDNLIPDISNLATKEEIPSLDLYAFKSDIPDITNLANRDEIPVLDNYALRSEIPNITGFATKEEIPSLTNYALKSDIPDITSLSTKSETNTALAVKADLVDGKIPAAQLPSYVDDVLEAVNVASFPLVGESGKIYVDTTSNITYRWTGSIYTEISKSLAIGETSSSAYRGDRGKTAYDHSQIITGNPHNTKGSDIANIPSGNVTSITVQNAINELDVLKVDKITGKGLTSNDYTTEEKNKLQGISNNANNYVHPSTHSADMIVDGTTNKAFSSTEKTKLAGISANADVSVNPDWNATSGKAQILNKPNLDATIPTTRGGTGLTSIGTAGQYLVVNSSATGLEWINSRDKGVNTVTTLASLPITKRLITASVTSNTTISLASNLDVGDELHIIVYNNSASSITQTLPNSGNFISLSGDSIAIPSGIRIEINILCYASNSYLIRAL